MSSTWFINRIMQPSLNADKSWNCAAVADFFSHHHDIARQCLRVGQLISSFKRVAVDQTSEHRRNFDLLDLIDDHIMALRPSMKNAHWEIKVEVPRGIYCDSYPGPLGQVIDNSIQNASIHAFTNRETGLLLIHASASDTMVELRFQNDDNGIAESDKATARSSSQPFSMPSS